MAFTEDGSPNRNAKTVDPKQQQPAIFMFQPTRFEIVDDADLDEWTKMLADDVGMAPMAQFVGNKKALGVTGTVMLCGSPEKRDGCDQV